MEDESRKIKKVCFICISGGMHSLCAGSDFEDYIKKHGLQNRVSVSWMGISWLYQREVNSEYSYSETQHPGRQILRESDLVVLMRSECFKSFKPFFVSKNPLVNLLRKMGKLGEPLYSGPLVKYDHLFKKFPSSEERGKYLIEQIGVNLE